MTNFRIEFDNPWLLLLLIPALFFTLLPYFLSHKKYRRNRNRITSIVLHLVAIVLAITVLSGITFKYEIPNKENEVILLVDKSDSNKESDLAKDEFVFDVLSSVNSEFRIGVVTFGYDQVYAAPLSGNGSEVYANYIRADLPDGSASDIAAALNYASGLFTKPASARIVLISDGVETDGNVAEVIKAVSAQGIKVDTVNFPNELGSEAQIVSVTYPDSAIRHGEEFEITVGVQSSYEGAAVLTMFDDATQIGESVPIRLVNGIQTVSLDAILPLPGLHKLSFEITEMEDVLSQNNTYNSYLYIETFDNILIIESITGESAALKGLLPDKKITVINAADQFNMPKTVDQLRVYDEVIMVNVANSDLVPGFDAVLYDYVKNVGGGLFTVCGNEEDANPNDDMFTANAFNREDMYGSLYQELLPVEIIEYEPPVAVVIIIDCSGSMYDPNGNAAFERSKLYAAQQGVESLLTPDTVNERDWVGIMTFSDFYEEGLELTPVVERDKILAAIDDLPKGGGGTVFTGAIERAGNALTELKESGTVDRCHIILVTDGEPTDSEVDYGAAIKRNTDRDITMSIVGIEADRSTANRMKYILDEYAGLTEDNYHSAGTDNIGTKMREDLRAPLIKDVNYTTFKPTIDTFTSVVAGINEKDIPTLDGFYGSKAKPGAQVILDGEFVPIYAQWKFGKGSVGSFMCDLNGTWSDDFIKSDVGVQLVNNMISALFPSESIQIPSIRLSLREENYGNDLNIFADAQPGETVQVKVIPRFHDGETLVLVPDPSEAFGKVSFDITEPGVYEIQVNKLSEDGTVIATHSIYKAFSYSQEYNPFIDPEDSAQLLSAIAEAGEGFVLNDPYEVFENVIKFLNKEFDPRVIFIIIALIAFLLDVAVRKFKFKWPHEIIRDWKKAEKK